MQLPFNCQWQDLKDLFRAAGNILRADITLGPDGRSRGFGTVLFATPEDAHRAVEMFNGYININSRPIASSADINEFCQVRLQRSNTEGPFR